MAARAPGDRSRRRPGRPSPPRARHRCPAVLPALSAACPLPPRPVRVPDDVPDHQRDRPVRQGQRVEPVTPGRGVLLGRQVTAGDLHSRQDGQVVRKQGLLQCRDDVAGLGVQPFGLGPSCLGGLLASEPFARVHSRGDHPADRPVLPQPGHGEHVDDQLERRAVGVVVLHAQATDADRLSGSAHLLDLGHEPLRQQFRGHLPQGAAHGIGPPDRLRARRVQRGDDQVRPLEAESEHGQLREDGGGGVRFLHRRHGSCTRLPRLPAGSGCCCRSRRASHTRPRRPNGCVSSARFRVRRRGSGRGRLDGREVALAGHALCGCRSACGLTGRIPAAG